MRSSAYLKIFLTILVSTLVLCTIASYAIVKYVNEEGTNSFNSLVKSRFDVKAAHKDVVLLGDSSLLMGISTEELEKKDDIKAINLGLVGYCGPLVFDLLLDTYLKNNDPPKLIVFYVAASTPYYFADHRYEKTYAYVRNAPISALLKNYDQIGVQELLQASWKILKDKSKTFFEKKPAARSVAKANGFNDAAALAPNSNTDSWQSKHLHVEYLRQFKQRYTSPQTRVVIYVAPMPEGEKAFDHFNEQYLGIADNLLYQLPREYFMDAVHVNRNGVPVATERLGTFIKGLRDR